MRGHLARLLPLGFGLVLATALVSCCRPRLGPTGRVTPFRFKSKAKTGKERLAGPFRAVVASAHHTCVLDAARRASCFGGDNSVTPPMVAAPKDPLQVLATGRRFACGIVEATREITCWGSCTASTCAPPPGKFDNLFLGDDGGCATRDAGGVTCFGGGLPATPPSIAAERLVQIVVGAGWIVGRRPEGTLVSWGGPQAVATDPRLTSAIATLTPFRLIGGAGATLCMVDMADKLRCLAHHGNREPPVVSGVPMQLAFSNPRGAVPACLLFDPKKRTGGETRCTASNKGKSLAPLLGVTAIAAGDEHVCGLAADDSLTCVGEDLYGQISGGTLWP